MRVHSLALYVRILRPSRASHGNNSPKELAGWHLNVLRQMKNMISLPRRLSRCALKQEAVVTAHSFTEVSLRRLSSLSSRLGREAAHRCPTDEPHEPISQVGRSTKVWPNQARAHDGQMTEPSAVCLTQAYSPTHLDCT